jgi:hypothetical protein
LLTDSRGKRRTQGRKNKPNSFKFNFIFYCLGRNHFQKLFSITRKKFSAKYAETHGFCIICSLCPYKSHTLKPDKIRIFFYVSPLSSPNVAAAPPPNTTQGSPLN